MATCYKIHASKVFVILLDHTIFGQFCYCVSIWADNKRLSVPVCFCWFVFVATCPQFYWIWTSTCYKAASLIAVLPVSCKLKPNILVYETTSFQQKTLMLKQSIAFVLKQSIAFVNAKRRSCIHIMYILTKV